MRVGGDFHLPPPPMDEKKLLQWLRRLSRTLGQTIPDIIRILSDGISLGDGTDTDNLSGKWISYTSNAVADTEDTVTHNTGEVPVGYWVLSRDKAGLVYDGGTAWTTTALYLKSNVSSLTAKLFVILGPKTS